MPDFRGIDTEPGRENRALRAIWTAIEELRSEKRASATTIGDGDLRLANGGSLVVDGGEVIALDEDGSVLVRIGMFELGDRGFAAYRDNGAVALEVRRLVDAAYIGQSVAIYDAGGRRVLQTDDLLGGLRSPYFEHPFQPVASVPGTPVTCGPYGFERSTQSTTFDTLFVYDGKRQNPFLDLKVAGVCSDATTAGEVRVVDLETEEPLSDFFGGPAWVGSIPAGSTSYVITDPGPSQTVTAGVAGPNQYVRLGLQVRRTAGAGVVTVAIPQSIGG